jgi:hypothetical protein
LFQDDKNRVRMGLQPLHVVGGRFPRINQHPVMFPSVSSLFLFSFTKNWIKLLIHPLQSAGVYSFSVGITEVLNTNLVVELSADDIVYDYRR